VLLSFFGRVFSRVPISFLLFMATNPPIGDGHRKGAVRNRSQFLNPKTKLWTKRDVDTGQFMDNKSGGEKFKGVRKEK